MNAVVNNMKYIEHNELYISAINKYLTLVFVEDVKSGMTFEYADFLDNYATSEDIDRIMRSGFKPYELRNWLNGNLGLK